MAIDKIIIGNNRQSSLTAGVDANNFVRVQDLNGVVDDANTDIAANTAAIAVNTAAIAGIQADINIAEVTLNVAAVQGLNAGTTVVLDGTVGYVTEFVGAVIILDHAGAAFTSGGTLEFVTETNGDPVSITIPAASITAGADSLYVVQTGGTANLQVFDDDGIILKNATAPFAGGGTSEVRLRIAYRLHPHGL